MSKINILFQSKPNFSDNARALYEFMKKKYNDKMNFYWVVDNLEDYNKLNSEINCVLNDSRELYELMPKIDIIFATHGQLIERKQENQIYVNLWHGVGPKKIGYMLPTELMAAGDEEYYEKLRESTDYIIVPNKFWQLVFCAIFKTNYNRILPLGYPKLYSIINASGKENLNKIYSGNINKYKKIIFYTPTFKSGCSRVDSTLNTSNIFNIDKYNEEELKKFLKKENYLLCIKRHMSENASFFDTDSDNIFVITDNMLINQSITINDILNSADMLITDYSSLGIEFSALHRPVIFLNNDINEYIKNRGIVFDNPEFWFGKPKKRNIEMLEDEIKTLLENDIKNNDYEKWFGDLENGGCEEITNFFFESNKISKAVKSHVSRRKKLSKENFEKSKIIEEQKERIKYLETQEQKLYQIENSKSWKIMQKANDIRKWVIKK